MRPSIHGLGILSYQTECNAFSFCFHFVFILSGIPVVHRVTGMRTIPIGLDLGRTKMTRMQEMNNLSETEHVWQSKSQPTLLLPVQITEADKDTI